MSNSQTVPFVDHQVIAPALTAGAGTFNYNLQGVDRASIQLNTTFSNAGDTDVVTLKISNDGVHFVPFSISKTVTFTGGTTDSALFELGGIDFVWLQVSWGAPSAHTFKLDAYLYGTGGSLVW